MQAAAVWRAAGAAACLYAPSVALARLAGGSGAPEIDTVRVVLALLFCLSLGGLAVWWLRRYGGTRFNVVAQRGQERSVRVIEATRLHMRASLYVVEFEGRRILIAADQNGVVRLAESGPTAPTAQ